MSRYLLLLLLSAPLCGFAATPSGNLDAGMVNPGYHEKPAWFKESFLDIREDIGEAESDDKRVVLYFYQDGCPYCAKLLNDNFGNADIARKTQDHFDVIAINMWGDTEVVGVQGQQTTEKEFSKALRVQYTPTLLFMDESGKVVLRVNGYLHPHRFDVALDYVSARKESEVNFTQYLADANPLPASGKLHMEPGFIGAPADLSIKRERPLLVAFEQRQCPLCDELHTDILQREQVRESLEAFDVALLDMWSKEKIVTPDGRETTVRQWAQDMGVIYAPTLVFFDTKAQEVFRTEAYLKSFHIHGALDYVKTGDYAAQPEFQRYLQDRRAEMEARGIKVDLWD